MTRKKRVIHDERVDPRIRRLFATLLAPLDDGTVKSCLTGGEIGVGKEFKDREELLEERMKDLMASGLALKASRGNAVGEEGARSPSVRKALGRAKQEAMRTMLQRVKSLSGLWDEAGLNVATHFITSRPDGNEIPVRFVRPEGDHRLLPCVVYVHGGGMAVNSAFDRETTQFCNMIARQGVCVAAVDFRNAELSGMAEGANTDVAPFPAGLNDVCSCIEWVNGAAAELGVEKELVLVAGSSGGGNLALAASLRMKREGKLSFIGRGTYALCPYIAGSWPQSRREEGIFGTSHLNEENNGLFINLKGNEEHAVGYGLGAYRRRNPLAWFQFATRDDLRGMAPVVLSLDECDPLRDEGVALYRRMLAAGVRARATIRCGCVHGGGQMAAAVPDLSLGVAKEIADAAAGVDFRRIPLPVPASVPRSML